MRRASYATINRRRGQGLIPPNPKQWPYEHAGLDVRDRLGLEPEQPLDPIAVFALIPNASVHPHGVIPAADVYINHFRGEGNSSWSGMAITDADGYHLVFYNDAHSPNRVRATLMEEFFHLRFGHPRSAVRVYREEGKRRTFKSEIEKEAYHSGAAALVPYRPLHSMLVQGQPASKIAGHFAVSVELVVFRAKVTKCYDKMRRNR